MNPKTSALIIIDVQKGFDDPKWGKRNNPHAEENIAQLLALWRSVQGPIFHIKNDSTEANSPLMPGLEGNMIKDIVAPLPGEKLFIKIVNSAFIGTNLQENLQELGIKDLVIAGLTTDHCVSTTTRMGANLGFNCAVVGDATAAFGREGYNGKKYSAQEIHEMGLVSLQGEFAKILKTSDFTGRINTPNKLTKWEWAGLTEGANLADGHAHQPQNKSILRDLSKLYIQAEAGNQKDIQGQFEKVFFILNGQKSYKKLSPPLYQPACSFSIEALANYLRERDLSVALLHPCFDNLADILKRHHVKLTAISEDQLVSPGKGLLNITANAIFLVLPNNPTGFEPTKKQFMEIIDYCGENNKMLILDHSFRFYSNYTKWDQYKLLLKSGIDFVVFEDTGKTWPTLELKLGITLCSKSLYAPLKDITNDFLLNVSPFTFTIMTEYIKREGTKNVLMNVASNRKYIRQAVKGTGLEVHNSKNRLSVEWFRLPENWSASALTQWLHYRDIHILPGMPFFWNNPEQGESFIRIALQRPKNKFEAAVDALAGALNEYAKISSPK